MPIKRATLIAQTEERAVLNAWIERWRPSLRSLSQNQGCGCCVDIYEVEAPVEALAELPRQLLSWEPESGKPS